MFEGLSRCCMPIDPAGETPSATPVYGYMYKYVYMSTQMYVMCKGVYKIELVI